MTTKQIIEALLYFQGEAGVTPQVLKSLTSLALPMARAQLEAFMASWNEEAEHGIQVVVFNDVFKFATRPELGEVLTKLVTTERKARLSQAALETVAIIAYRQPITRTQINELRGVASEAVVSTLLVKGLVAEIGTSEAPGQAAQLGVTDKFFDYFQLRSLAELPLLPELNQVASRENIALFESQREEE